MTNTITTTPTSVLEMFEQNKLTPKDLDIEVSYYINEFLVNQSLNMIFASAGQGKSFLVLAIAIKLLNEGKISKCLYLDMDNSTIALKTRSLDELISKNLNLNYIHYSKCKESLSNMLFQLGSEVDTEKKQLTDYLIIIDSIRDFLGGRDMNSDREVKPVLDNLLHLRACGATIIFLHHTRKDDASLYKGSTSFINSVDTAFNLQSKKSENTLIYTLNHTKDRIPVNNSSFKLNTKTMELVQQNYQVSKLKEHEQSFISEVQAVLAKNTNGINGSKLLEGIGKKADDKTGRKNLQKFEGQFWASKRIPSENNSIIYYPLLNIAA